MKKKVIVVMVIISVTVGIVGLILFKAPAKKLTQIEKEKALTNILGRKPNLNPDIKTGDILYSGKYLSFKYPARAKIYAYRDPNSANNSNIIETFSFDIEKPRLILNLSVAQIPANIKELTDFPGVKFRQIPAAGYSESEVIVGDIAGLVFSKEANAGENAEKTGFFFVSNRFYSFAITGNNLEDVSELFDDTIKTLKFID